MFSALDIRLDKIYEDAELTSISKKIIQYINEANVTQYFILGDIFDSVSGVDYYERRATERAFKYWFDKSSEILNEKPMVFVWFIKILILFLILRPSFYNNAFHNKKVMGKIRQYLKSFGCSSDEINNCLEEDTVLDPFSVLLGSNLSLKGVLEKLEHFYSFSHMEEINSYNRSNKHVEI